MKLSNKIIELRKENKISQEQLAKELNVSRQSISLWENDQSRPSTDKLIELARFFNISIDNLISNDFENNEDTIVVKTIHTLETYKQMTFDVVPFIKRNIFRIIVLITFFVMIVSIFGFKSDDFIIFSLLYVFFIIPILIFSMTKIDNKKLRKYFNLKEFSVQTFIFKDNELMILYDDEVSTKTESVIKYDAFKKAILTNNILYLQHPTNKNSYFRISLDDLSNDNKLKIIEQIKSNNVDIKIKKDKFEFTNDKISMKLFSNKKLYLILVVMFLISISLFLITITTLTKRTDELSSYLYSRENLLDFIPYSIMLLPLLLMFGYLLYLSRRKFKSKFIVFSYVTTPLLFAYMLLMTIFMPISTKNEYQKDFTIVKDIFINANLYIPDDGLSVTINLTTKNYEKLLLSMPFTKKHNVLINENLELFEDSLLTNEFWVTEKSDKMESKLSIAIGQEADYYLIYNDTANNYNDQDLVIGLNKLFVFYYNAEKTEVLIYEYYLFMDKD